MYSPLSSENQLYEIEVGHYRIWYLGEPIKTTDQDYINIRAPVHRHRAMIPDDYVIVQVVREDTDYIQHCCMKKQEFEQLSNS